METGHLREGHEPGEENMVLWNISLLSGSIMCIESNKTGADMNYKGLTRKLLIIFVFFSKLSNSESQYNDPRVLHEIWNES